MSSFIAKQPKKDRDQITIKLDRDVLQNLERYCRYLDSSRDYVINQCLVFIFRKDRQFHEWAVANAETPNGSAAKVASK
jgi:predicted transcriptional regulator